MSPEQASGSSNLDGCSDIYSLGCVLYEMLAGHAPFMGTTAQEVLARHTLDAVPSARAARPSVPEGLEHVIQRAMAKVPPDRFASARSLIDALNTGVSAPVRSKRASWYAAGAVLGVVALITVWRPWGAAAVSNAGDSAPRVSPFLATSAVEKQPSWNPTESLIAFVSDEAGNDDIWLVDASGANPVNLAASHHGVDAHPTWSPDGQRIAFPPVSTFVQGSERHLVDGFHPVASARRAARTPRPRVCRKYNSGLGVVPAPAR